MKICFKNKNCGHLCQLSSIKFFLSLSWIYHTDEEYFLMNILENNHKCIPLRIFPLTVKKYQKKTMVLEKMSLPTEIIFVYCYKFILLLNFFKLFLMIPRF